MEAEDVVAPRLGTLPLLHGLPTTISTYIQGRTTAFESSQVARIVFRLAYARRLLHAFESKRWTPTCACVSASSVVAVAILIANLFFFSNGQDLGKHISRNFSAKTTRASHYGASRRWMAWICRPKVFCLKSSARTVSTSVLPSTVRSRMDLTPRSSPWGIFRMGCKTSSTRRCQECEPLGPARYTRDTWYIVCCAGLVSYPCRALQRCTKHCHGN